MKGNRKMILTATMDWFGGTSHKLHPYLWQLNATCGAITEEKSKPRNGYNRAETVGGCGLICWNIGTRSDMGYHVTLPSSLLREFRRQGVADDVLCEHLANQGVKASRMDIALDIRGNENENEIPSVSDFERSLADGSMTSIAQYVYKVGGVVGESKGETIYIGSRTSERMIRIYDKAIEQGLHDGSQWTRIELELKGSWAKTAQDMVIDTGNIAKVWRSLTSGFIKSCDLPQWVEIMTGDISRTEGNIRHEPDTLTWLFEQVVPAMVKYARKHPDVDIIEIVSSEYKRLLK